MIRRCRKDANHNNIVAMFERLGCTVVERHKSGIPGDPDIEVGCVGVNHLVEIKNPATHYGRKGMNANQDAFSRDWRGEKPYIVTSTDEAAALVQNWRRSE